jgi:type I restriction enzyme S subunit
MKTMTPNLDLKNINKSNWQAFRFKEIANKISETVDPNTTELEVYVGLEHIDAENIHIKRFGTPDDVSGGKLKCYPGDVIFGKRRAYQRKAAVVAFEGICSAHAFVFRANTDVIDPKLFPFFLHSDQFMHRMVDISVGGLSPTINWGDLKHQEFFLPPKDQQAKLAELLWAMDEVIEKENRLKTNLENSLNAMIKNEIHGIDLKGKVIREVLDELSNNEELVSLSELGELLKGKGIPKSDVQEVGLPCIRYGELYTRHNRIIRGFHSFISEEIKADSFKLQKHDVLFAGSGETITEIGKSAAFVDDFEAYAGSDTLLFRPNDMDGYYLGYLMNSQLVRQQLNKYGTGATVMHIYNSDLAKIKVPKIDRTKQEEIGKKLEVFTNSIITLESKMTSSKAFQRSLINQLF